MAGRLRTAPDPVAGASQIASSTNVDTLPRGRIGGDELTADITGITSGTGPAEAIVLDPVTVGDGRTIWLHCALTVHTNIAGGIALGIFEDGTQIQRKNLVSAQANRDLVVTIDIESQPSAGDHRYVLAIGVSGSDGNTVAAKADGASGDHGVGTFYCDDVGPAYP